MPRQLENGWRWKSVSKENRSRQHNIESIRAGSNPGDNMTVNADKQELKAKNAFKNTCKATFKKKYDQKYTPAFKPSPL